MQALMIRTLALVLLGAGAVFLTPFASAQSVNTASLARLINAGDFQAAQVQLMAQNPTAADRRFFEGLILKSQRRFDAAIAAFREVLRLDPNYLNARRELAHTLLLNKDYGPAQYHFEALLAIDQNPQMRSGYRRFLNVIHENKPIGFSGYVALVPSSNVNRGTNNTVFDTTLGQFVIDSTSQAVTGVGAQVGVSGFLRHVINPVSRISLNWNATATRYEDTDFNSTSGVVDLKYERLTDKGGWSISPYARKTLRADDADNDARGLTFALRHRLSDRTQFSGSLTRETRRYDLQDYQNGPFSAMNAGLRYQVTPSLSVSGGLGLEYSRPEAEHLKYDGAKLTLGLSRSWQGGTQANFGLEYGRRDFIGVYPLTTAPREDQFYKVSVGVQNSRINWGGFTPRVTCSHSINTSNVAFFDYDATECNAQLSRNF